MSGQVSSDDLLDAFDAAWATAERSGSEAPDLQQFCLSTDDQDAKSVTRAKQHAEKLIEIDNEYRVRRSTQQGSGKREPSTVSVGGSNTRANTPYPEVPDFKIESVLGRGGKGVVYQAQQLSMQRTVAIKTILPGGAGSANDIERLRNEARVLGNLRHPNIVTVYSLEEHDDRCYLVMEYVSGRDLSFHQRERLLSTREAATHVLTAAEAVEAAHHYNVLHRDIKPSNILLDDDGNIRVTDFGLSRQIEASDSDNQLTATSEILGTPGYISPEQARGFSRNLDATTDVYGMGATLYALLTGIAPFSGSDVLTILQQVRERQPTPVRTLQPSVPNDLQTNCLKCLEKRPSDRYQSAQLLADDLRRFLNGEPIHARPIPLVLRGIRWCRRNPVLTGLMTAVAVLVALTIGLFINRSIENENALAVTTAQNEQLEDALGREQTANEQLGEALAREQEATAEIYDNTIRLARLEYESNEVDNALRLLLSLRKRYSDDGVMPWEWMYLWGLIHSSQQSWKMPMPDADWIGAAAFSPDGRLVALSNIPPRFDHTKYDQRGRVTIREMDSDHVVAELPDVFAVHDLLFSSDGSVLLGIEAAFGSKDNELFQGPCKIRRWETKTWSELLSIETDFYFERATFNADESLLLALGVPLLKNPAAVASQVWKSSRSLVVVDMAAASVLEYRHWLAQPDDAGFVAILEDGSFKTFSVGRPRPQVCSQPGYPKTQFCGRRVLVSVEREAFGPDKGELLIRRRSRTGRQQAEVLLRQVSELSFAKWPVVSTAVSNLDSNDRKTQAWPLSWAVPRFRSKFIELWSPLLKPNERWPLERSIAIPTIDTFAVDPTESYLAVATDGGEIRVWDMDTWQRQPSRREHVARIRSLEFDADGKRLISGDWNGTVHLWDTHRPPGVVDTLAPQRGDRVEALAWDEAAHHVTAVRLQVQNPQALRRPEAPLQRLRPGQQQAELPVRLPLPERFRSAGRTVAISADGKTIAVPSTMDDAVLNLLSSETSEVMKSLPHRTRVSFVRFFDNGIATAAWSSGYFGAAEPEDGEIRLSQLKGDVDFAVSIPSTRIYRLAVSPDFALLAASCQQFESDSTLYNFVRVWDVASGKRIDEFAMPSWTMGLEFGPASGLLAAISFDEGNFVLRDVRNRASLRQIDGMQEHIQDLHFTSGGLRMVSASRHEVAFWNTETWRPVIDLKLDRFSADYVFNPQLRLYDNSRTVLANQANGTIRMWQIPRTVEPTMR